MLVPKRLLSAASGAPLPLVLPSVISCEYDGYNNFAIDYLGTGPQLGNDLTSGALMVPSNNFFLLAAERECLLERPADADSERNRQQGGKDYLVVCDVWCKSCWEKEHGKAAGGKKKMRTAKGTAASAATTSSPPATSATVSLELQPPEVDLALAQRDELEARCDGFSIRHGCLSSYKIDAESVRQAEQRGAEGRSCLLNLKLRLALDPPYQYPPRTETELATLSHEALACLHEFLLMDSPHTLIWCGVGDNSSDEVVEAAAAALFLPSTCAMIGGADWDRDTDTYVLVEPALLPLTPQERSSTLDAMLYTASSRGSLPLIRSLLAKGASTGTQKQITALVQAHAQDDDGDDGAMASLPEFACLGAANAVELLAFFVKDCGLDVTRSFKRVVRRVRGQGRCMPDWSIVQECVSTGNATALQFCLDECGVAPSADLARFAVKDLQVEPLRAVVTKAGGADNICTAAEWQVLLHAALCGGGYTLAQGDKLSLLRYLVAELGLPVTGNLRLEARPDMAALAEMPLEELKAQAIEEGQTRRAVGRLDKEGLLGVLRAASLEPRGALWVLIDSSDCEPSEASLSTLIDAGCDVDGRITTASGVPGPSPSSSTSPLSHSILKGHFATAEHLLARGAQESLTAKGQMQKLQEWRDRPTGGPGCVLC